jgi:DNA (cytosine-5)-methyltransferase 1
VLAAHKANHPRTKHLEADIWEVQPRKATGGRPVDVLWASPDCTHFSVAKGGKPRKQGIRSLAWAVVRWATEVKPRVIFLENVSEFRTWGPLDEDGRPQKARMGEHFRAWLRKLERLGYRVDFRILDASHYGTPTKRKRLFLVARRDGLPVRWPNPTHDGLGLPPPRAAAECIDWNLPCPSIFERERPLAEKTLWRIAEGIRRFVLESPRPFIVGIDHQGGGGKYAAPADEALSTITTKARHAMVAPSLVQISHGEVDKTGKRRGVGARSVEGPLPTVTAANDFGLAAPVLVKVNHGRPGDNRGEPVDGPMSTITASQRSHALVAPSLIQVGYGEREGQRARTLDLQEPLGTVVAQGQKHALVAAFLAKHFGGVVGQSVDRPASTITAVDHHGLAAATLVRFRGTAGQLPAQAANDPMPTIAASGNHVAEVRAFLTAFYGSDGTAGKGQALTEPMRTLTAKHRLGLVTVEGVDFQITDIGLRMLEPGELLKAQFGRFAAGYDLSAAKTKAAKVRLIGNSVPPEVAEAVVRANLGALEGASRVA